MVPDFPDDSAAGSVDTPRPNHKAGLHRPASVHILEHQTHSDDEAEKRIPKRSKSSEIPAFPDDVVSSPELTWMVNESADEDPTSTSYFRRDQETSLSLNQSTPLQAPQSPTPEQLLKYILEGTWGDSTVTEPPKEDDWAASPPFPPRLQEAPTSPPSPTVSPLSPAASTLSASPSPTASPSPLPAAESPIIRKTTAQGALNQLVPTSPFPAADTDDPPSPAPPKIPRSALPKSEIFMNDLQRWQSRLPSRLAVQAVSPPMSAHDDSSSTSLELSAPSPMIAILHSIQLDSELKCARIQDLVALARAGPIEKFIREILDYLRHSPCDEVAFWALLQCFVNHTSATLKSLHLKDIRILFDRADNYVRHELAAGFLHKVVGYKERFSVESGLMEVYTLLRLLQSYQNCSTVEDIKDCRLRDWICQYWIQFPKTRLWKLSRCPGHHRYQQERHLAPANFDTVEICLHWIDQIETPIETKLYPFRTLKVLCQDSSERIKLANELYTAKNCYWILCSWLEMIWKHKESYCSRDLQFVLCLLGDPIQWRLLLLCIFKSSLHKPEMLMKIWSCLLAYCWGPEFAPDCLEEIVGDSSSTNDHGSRSSDFVPLYSFMAAFLQSILDLYQDDTTDPLAQRRRPVCLGFVESAIRLVAAKASTPANTQDAIQLLLHLILTGPYPLYQHEECSGFIQSIIPCLESIEFVCMASESVRGSITQLLKSTRRLCLDIVQRKSRMQQLKERTLAAAPSVAIDSSLIYESPSMVDRSQAPSGARPLPDAMLVVDHARPVGNKTTVESEKSGPFTNPELDQSSHQAKPETELPDSPVRNETTEALVVPAAPIYRNSFVAQETERNLIGAFLETHKSLVKSQESIMQRQQAWLEAFVSMAVRPKFATSLPDLREIKALVAQLPRETRKQIEELGLPAPVQQTITPQVVLPNTIQIHHTHEAPLPPEMPVVTETASRTEIIARPASGVAGPSRSEPARQNRESELVSSTPRPLGEGSSERPRWPPLRTNGTFTHVTVQPPPALRSQFQPRSNFQFPLEEPLQDLWTGDTISDWAALAAEVPIAPLAPVKDAALNRCLAIPLPWPKRLRDESKRVAVKRKESGPGLRNIGNTCYANAFLQALFLTTTFVVNLFRFELPPNENETKESVAFGENPKILSELQTLFAALLISKRSEVDPTNLMNHVSDLLFPRGTHHDSSEFGRYLMTSLGGYEKPLIHTIFTGKIRNHIQCLTCNTISERDEAIHDLSLFLPETSASKKKHKHAPLSVEKLINDMLMPETMDGADSYQCDTCRSKRRAQKWMTIVSPPHHLMVNLNRFKWNTKKQEKEKVHQSIYLNPRIVFSGYPYVLYAAVMHKGKTPNSGHYYTIGGLSEPLYAPDALRAINDMGASESEISPHDVRHPLTYRFDDHKVTLINKNHLACDVLAERSLDENLESETPYVIFYRCLVPRASPVIEIPRKLRRKIKRAEDI
eukprot:Gregarina_sp_Poly_1__3690@NODE_208_length_11377_cov_32_000884_g185_i0_p1_GENE_NODE_208_length_11377_cov_32_000884_g185_i0NODE_208_length_11377_cov_32_000884_g185_i0_p1_ORF_typecomplete_len1469_score223_90UCH/PF00443_29/1_5e51UCH_1/PF13423_6/4_6e21_NODE_208_length_11377_cov_32_000884_g185_i0904496